jgi:hypothetical protein
MRVVMLSLAAGVLALSGGCATMGEDECTTADWRAVGYEDGAAGRAPDRIGEYRQACARYGVSPDLDAWLAGREAGLATYCQPENGFRVGARGAGYPGDCPAELAPGFVAAWEQGRELYALERAVGDARSELAARRAELERVEDAMASAALILLDGDSSKEARAQALLDTRQLAERKGRLEFEIVELERRQARAEAELEAWQETSTYRG